jgi:hypothetical protein
LQRAGGDLKQGIARCNTPPARPAIGNLLHDRQGRFPGKSLPQTRSGVEAAFPTSGMRKRNNLGHPGCA